MATDAKVEGLEQMHANMKALQDKLKRKALLKAMRPGAKEFQRAVEAEAPKRVGYIKGSVRVRAIKRKRGESKTSASMGVAINKKIYPWRGKMVKPFYAWFVHNGTARGITPNPFVERAFSSLADKVGDMIIVNLNIK